MSDNIYETQIEVEKSGWWHGNIMLDTDQEVSFQQYKELFETNAISYEMVCSLMEHGSETGEAIPVSYLRDHIRESIEHEILSGSTCGEIFGDELTWGFSFEGTLDGQDISWDDLSEESQEHIVHGILEEDWRQGEICENSCFDLTVDDFEISDDGYITGSIALPNAFCAFEYNIATEDLSFHKYTQPGWLTGSSYETELPKDISDNIEAITEAAMEAITDFMDEQEKTTSLDDLIAAAGEPTAGSTEQQNRDDREDR